MNAPEIPYRSCPATSSSKSPIIPSMSVPRWTCASKISAPSGSSARDDRLEALDQRLGAQQDVLHLSLGVYARRLFTLPRRYSRYGCGSIASAPIARSSVSIGVNLRPCR